MNLSPLPIQKFFANNGRPLVGGKLFTYTAGTNNKVATYPSDTGGPPNTNPIILDFRGECRIWLDPLQSYKFVLSPPSDGDPPTDPIWTVDNITVAPQAFSNAAVDTGSVNNISLSIPQISSPVTFTRIIFQCANYNTGPTTISINGGTAAPLVWQSDFPFVGGELVTGGMYEAIFDGAVWQIQGPALTPGDVRLYGAVLDGVTNDTVAIQRWASRGGMLTWPVPRTGLITAAISLQSNSTITFVKGGKIATATPDISILFADTKTNISISGGTLQQTVAGNAPYTGGINLLSCQGCTVSDMELIGMQWSGIYLDSSSRCIISGNYMHDFLASSAGDKADITVYRNSSFNLVIGNRCFGGAEVEHGIFTQDPGGIGTFLPAHNRIVDNWVGDHKSYGIVFYIGAGNGDNQCINNTIQNIIGTGIAGASGSGIYCVGNGLGAMLVSGNLVRNCCISTTSAANGPGGISINDTPSTASKIIVCNNTVEDMVQGSGILISTVVGGAVVSGNTVKIPLANDGTGPGGATLRGDAIRVIASFDTEVTGNVARNLGVGDAFFSFASGVSMDRISVVGNTFRAATGNAIRFDRTAAFVHTDCVISANQIRSDGANNAINIIGTDRVAITGNSGSSNTGAAISVSSGTATRIANNVMNTNGTNGIVTAGTCTLSNFEKSNRINANVLNGATGFRIEAMGVIPGAGTYVAGDTVWHLAPAAGASPGAICTTGGTPGTWKSMANLAP